MEEPLKEVQPREGLHAWPEGAGELQRGRRRRAEESAPVMLLPLTVPVAVKELPMKLPLPEKLLPFQVALFTVVLTGKPTTQTQTPKPTPQPKPLLLLMLL